MTRQAKRSPRRLSSPERRRQLLAVAADLVASDGASRLTMAEVAKRARVSIPIVYRHFENRTELLLALLEQQWQELDDRVRKAVGENDGFPAMVHSAIGAYFDSVEARGPVLLALLAERTADGVFERRRKERRRAVVRWWGTQVKQAYGLDGKTAEAAAAIVNAATDGAGSYWIANPKLSRSFVANLLETLVLSYLAALSKPR